MTAITRFAVIALLATGCGSKKSDAPASETSATTPSKTEPAPAKPADGLELPQVPDGFAPGTLGANVLAVTPANIAIGGTLVVPLADGVVSAAEREGGAAGMKIPRLVQILWALYGQKPRPALQLAIDKRVPYRTFVEVVFSAKQTEAGGFRQFTLVAKSKDALVEATFALPKTELLGTGTSDDQNSGGKRPGADLAKQIEDVRNSGQAVKIGKDKAADKELTTPKPKPKDSGTARRPAPDFDPPAMATILAGEDKEHQVKLAVAITKTEVMLWSLSGLEGTLKDPKLRVPLEGAGAPLRKAIEEVVARRWPTGPRAEKSILIMAEAATPMQRIAEVIAAVRSTADGKPLFPDLVFATGFE